MLRKFHWVLTGFSASLPCSHFSSLMWNHLSCSWISSCPASYPKQGWLPIWITLLRAWGHRISHNKHCTSFWGTSATVLQLNWLTHFFPCIHLEPLLHWVDTIAFCLASLHPWEDHGFIFSTDPILQLKTATKSLLSLLKTNHNKPISVSCGIGYVPQES